MDIKKHKDLINASLKCDIVKYKRFLCYFNIEESNFSKAVNFDLENFSKKLKFLEQYLTNFEKEGIIFVMKENKNILNIEIMHKLKILELLANKLKTLNLKILKEQEKLSQNKEALKYNKVDNLFLKEDYIMKNIRKLVGSNENYKNFDFENSQKEINRVSNLKIEISNEMKELEEIKKEKESYLKKVNQYCNLPADVEKIKEMIHIKKEELNEINMYLQYKNQK
jgi:hypothetical protein